MPVVGMPLPLVSYGGTSVVSLLTGFGVLMSIPRRLPRDGGRRAVPLRRAARKRPISFGFSRSVYGAGGFSHRVTFFFKTYSSKRSNTCV